MSKPCGCIPILRDGKEIGVKPCKNHILWTELYTEGELVCPECGWHVENVKTYEGGINVCKNLRCDFFDTLDDEQQVLLEAQHHSG